MTADLPALCLLSPITSTQYVQSAPPSFPITSSAKSRMTSARDELPAFAMMRFCAAGAS
jgi:hypothetical protein